MPLSNYTELISSVLQWLGRPDDPLIAPAVPDFIALFEAEARDRLSFRFGEQLDVEIWGDGGIFPLPCDFHSLRRVMYDGRGLRYHPPYLVDDMTEGGGRPLWYTLEGLQLRIAPPPDTELALVIDYIQGIPPLSARVPTNALLQSAPDLYLYGSLACAEGYIGNDERVAGWLQMREAGFERVRRAGIQAMTGGSPLRVRVIGETP